MALLMGFLSAFLHVMSPSPGMAECEQNVESLRHLTDKGAARTLDIKAPSPTTRRPEPGCAVITFTLTAEGEPTKLEVLVASSEWMRRFALRVVRQSRYSAGEEEDAALILNTRLSDN
jgi:hypothetical protein